MCSSDLQSYSESLAVKVRCFGTEHASVANTHNNIAEVYREQGDYEKAMFHYNLALSIYRPSLGDSHVGWCQPGGAASILRIEDSETSSVSESESEPQADQDPPEQDSASDSGSEASQPADPG